jgi:nitrogen fixation protein FixH
MTLREYLAGDDRWIPWTFVAFFVVVVGANAVMAAFAVGSWTGLTTDNAYRNGLAYNRQLDAAQAQQALGWRVALDVTRAADGGTDIAVRLRDRFGYAISDAEVGAALVRPTHEGADIEATLEPRGEGRYGAHIDLPLPGQWDLKLQIIRDGQRHKSIRRLHLS